jgi:hypothetical protein
LKTVYADFVRTIVEYFFRRGDADFDRAVGPTARQWIRGAIGDGMDCLLDGPDHDGQDRRPGYDADFLD